MKAYLIHYKKRQNTRRYFDATLLHSNHVRNYFGDNVGNDKNKNKNNISSNLSFVRYCSK
jgi:hypothetical protein